MTALYRSSQWGLDGLNDSAATGNTHGINWAALSGIYDGTGIKIGVVDSGFDYNTADLSGQFDIANSEDVQDTGTVSILPDALSGGGVDYHGTGVSGIIGAGGTLLNGVAAGALMTGYYIRFATTTSHGPTSLSDITTSLHDAVVHNDIVNGSWSEGAQFNFTPFNFASSFYSVLDSDAAAGRNGLGTIMVFSAGNDRITNNGDTNAYFTSDRHVIAVAATDAAGHIENYSTPGASLLVAAPGASIETDTTLNADGDNNSANDVVTYSGTSFSAPIVSGVVALMLQANPALGARDVQDIIALSAIKTDLGTNTSWALTGDVHWNGGGNYASNDLGFGLIDANAAVHLAESWGSIGGSAATFNNESNLHVAGSATGGGSDTFAYGSPKSYTFSVSGAGFWTERVDLTVNLSNFADGHVIVDITDPYGKVTHLADDVGYPNAGFGNMHAILDSTHALGEDPTGTWTVTFSKDVNDGHTDTVNALSLDIYGTSDGADDTYFYTDDFSNLSGRGTLADANGGTDTVDLGALSSAVTIDLTSGHTSTIDGVSGVSSDGTIENVVGTHFNDTITGNASNNIINGGVGADTMAGGAGDDTYYVDNASDVVTEGSSAGHDTEVSTITVSLAANVEDLILHGAGLTGYGNSSDNTLYADSLGDTLVTGGGNDVEYGGAGNDVLYNTSGSGTTVYEYGNGGSDYFSGGGTGTTTIMVQSGSGVSTMVGGAGYSWMYAGNGGDYEVAGSGGSSMHGGNGADHEYSAAANDVMTGGSGNDVFVFGPSTQGHDVITDFSVGHDIGVFDHTSFATTGAVIASMTADAGGVYVNHGSDWAYFQGHVIADFHTSDFLIV